MGKLFNLESRNGDCIADFGDVISRMRLHCVEELGNDYVSHKSYASVWITVNKREFWMLIKEICDKNTESNLIGVDVRNEFFEISNHIERLIRQLEE